MYILGHYKKYTNVQCENYVNYGTVHVLLCEKDYKNVLDENWRYMRVEAAPFFYKVSNRKGNEGS